MVMEVGNNIFIPKQPFMVKLAPSYYKYVVNNYGISHFYSFKADKGTNLIETSVPDACIDIIFHYDLEGKHIGADWYGTDLMPHSMKCYEACTHFGVRFLPGQLPLIADASMFELIDHVIPYDLAGKHKGLPEKIARCRSFKEQINVFLNIYMPYYYQNNSGAALKDYLVDTIIRAYGNTKIEKLSEETGYSASYIDKIFYREIGISPKRFSGIIRFQWMLNRFGQHICNDNVVDYRKVTELIGYYDQSHMIREFKKHSSLTPNKYFVELMKMDYMNRLKIIN